MDTPSIKERIALDNGTPTLALFFFLFGAFALLNGLAVPFAQEGMIEYDSQASNALFLLMFGIMIAYTGFTPAGSLHRSWLIYFIGTVLSIIGMFSAMSPGTISEYVNYILGAVLLIMGIVRLSAYLLRLKRVGVENVPLYFTASLVVMYVVCMISGILLFDDGYTPIVATIVMSVLGVSLLIIACTVGRIERTNPDIIPWMNDNYKESSHWILNTPDLSLKNMFMLQGGFTTLMMAVIAFFGAMELVSCDVGESITIFIFILALQIMVAGDTPLGEFKVNWALIVLGMLIAIMAMISCAVPGLLTESFSILLGLENILMGVFGLYHMYGINNRMKSKASGPLPRMFVNILLTGTLLYIMVFPFGLNLIFSIIPSIITLVILIITGVSLIRLTMLLRKATNSGLIPKKEN